MKNICSCGYASNYTQSHINQDSSKNIDGPKPSNRSTVNNSYDYNKPSELFSINEDRLEIFGISINIDDLIILIMLFFMFRESNVDYSIIIILALILFDQS